MLEMTGHALGQFGDRQRKLRLSSNRDFALEVSLLRNWTGKVHLSYVTAAVEGSGAVPSGLVSCSVFHQARAADRGRSLLGVDVS